MAGGFHVQAANDTNTFAASSLALVMFAFELVWTQFNTQAISIAMGQCGWMDGWWW